MLDLKDITLHYGRSRILNGISMQADLGEVTCVMGCNGVGKTSLMKAVTGTHPRSGGSMTFDGQEIGVVPAHQLARAGIAYVPQGRDIFPLLTVKENLETGFACLPKEEHFIPDHIYELFPILKDFLARRGGDLSGGQQQQLAIARALITKPKLLVLDEPTEGIQPNIIKQIGEVIKLLRGQGDMAIILVEQFFDFAYDLADRFVVLRRGEVVLEGRKGAVERDALLEGVSV
ncbi:MULTISPECIES: urea ABC transporter ATP-binding subunit UrtE [Rhodobacterales]|jgi:urea transport system ATP-binding protein|uniref:urea ABC transporter ATP-binding subunit UrtE n=1 Tax=Rhodobacterales TaxID=204455 RepID=UPI00237F1347|nr:urea ABC transporter ATP-binding subunit UrtE [Phaeobacter gallaeciensis]MDE4141163.1 urea ABC transporter ATP-binding subunit UrtE [Phaeobacter gallaeciensis]MDE4149608.1 urea ABC transporter ATP-binding subunit UrtE [Phaeobacter gallaeciensis]MDE4153942.1 urea ABC transporter ATP-binding subunit UrtE [Phaeobacter gallaeciensis]MDE4229334.1 urea ABC transporter ATP-binding subunit UrtE [Phaeobacter gallaeciensis]MDE4258298.1 urea ABC transporter ATP-binding subunit UrtE [Phaeobacter gallae